MNEVAADGKWECYLCAREFSDEWAAGGWIADYNPLCDSCADSVFYDTNSRFYKLITFHYSVGEIKNKRFTPTVTKPH